MALLRGVQAAAHDPVNDGPDRLSSTRLNRRILLNLAHARPPQVYALRSRDPVFERICQDADLVAEQL